MKFRAYTLSTARSDFGILSNLVKKFEKSKKFESRLIVSGTHFEKKFGLTVNEIRKDKINKYDFIKISNSFFNKFDDKEIFNHYFKSFSKFFEKKKPQLLIVLGDRFETLSAVLAAKFLSIPIAHIHGGEVTVGSYDDSFRHCITKLANIHFTSHRKYKNRVIQLGENPNTVFNVGSLSSERLKSLKFYTKAYLKKKYKINFGQKNYLVTLHPETENIIEFKRKNKIFFKFIQNISDANIFFTLPSPDKGHELIMDKIKKICKNKNIFLIKSPGYKGYVSLVRNVDCVIGNSSSGFYEVPSLKRFTLNVGNRQSGRVILKSIISCDFNKKKLSRALEQIDKIKKNKKIYFKKLKNIKTSDMIIKNLVNYLDNFYLSKKKILPKKFYDIGKK
jgi:GDP/UDP-N,N'-diacetylbacillosamine 2-epimerase (hydrolysing)